MKWYIQKKYKQHDDNQDSLISTSNNSRLISECPNHESFIIDRKLINKHHHHSNRKERHFFTSLCLITFILIVLILISTNNFNLIFRHQFIIWPNPGLDKKSVNETDRIISNESQKVLPHCIIVGVRKCGTRALLEFLDIHPQITKVINEIHFFDDEKHYNLGLEWYRQQMPAIPINQSNIVIEKTPAYFVTESVPERIYAMNASIKIILIVREPVVRLISDYAQLASNRMKGGGGQRRIETFEESVLYPNGKVNSSYKGIRISMYAVYFSRWIKLFSKNQIHVVDGDQFVYDPLPELKKIETFLGLPHLIGHDDFIYNVTKGFYCIRLADNQEKCLNKNKGRRHPDINPVIIKRLRKFYEPYNKFFFSLVGRSFNWPNR